MRGGEIVASAGDPARVCFLRSSAKPIQALALVRARPDLDDAEIAIACASHRAEPAQIAAVRRLLEAGGNTEADLECGQQEGRLPGAIHHNCSGKHAGFLALARAEGWELTGYRLPDHPVQRTMLAEVAAAAELDESAIPTAVDGCAVVTFALSLERMAAAFTRLAELDGAERVLAAMRAHPELVGGLGSLDTDLMQTHPGWVAKGGAEGLLCAVSPDGTGYALKAEDGSSRPLRAALGRFLGEDLGPTPIENTRGERVGEVEIDPSDVAAYEAELANVWVKPPPKLTGHIEIQDYDPEWPELYAREEARLRAILGDRIVRLEHAGSTSVPGLPAKPIIDIVLEVPDSSDEQRTRPISRQRAIPCLSGSRSGSSIACSRGRTLTSTSTSSALAARRRTGCCSSATGCARTPPTGSAMPPPSTSSRRRTGPTCSSTRTRRPPSSARSWRERKERNDESARDL